MYKAKDKNINYDFIYKKAIQAIINNNKMKYNTNYKDLDTATTDMGLEMMENLEVLQKLMIWLTRQEYEVICRRYGVYVKKWPVQKIADKFGVKTQTIYAIIKRGLTRMREHAEGMKLT
jgi:DNA-directed RNA polymerase sigma subunit (sigma70/sigma32)